MPALETTATAPLVAAGLLGGYSVARYSGRRELGGVVLAGFGLTAGHAWRLRSGYPTAFGLLAGYTAAFGLSHPLAKKIGAWPSVLAVTAAAAGTAYVVNDRG